MSANRWDVMSIREYTDASGQNKTNWTKIGVAFTNKNGSINVQLDALPLDGKCQLQVPLSREEREAMFSNKQQGQQRGGPPRQQGGGFGGRQQQGNPRNAGQQQRGQAQQRFGQRGQSQPQQGGFARAPDPPYSPDPEADIEAGYVDVGQGESGWQVGNVWIDDARNLPKDHPDFIPF